jgi:hypothetical protein
MTNKSRNQLLESFRPDYLQADKKSRAKLLCSFIESTGYSRKHAITLLNHGRNASARRRQRKGCLEEEALFALVLAWRVSNRICSKRLVPFLPELIADLEQNGHLELSSQAKEQLLGISAATVDRVLKKERAKYARSPMTTRRSSLVKKKVPIRTFTEWNDVRPGFFEADTVGHTASDVSGSFLSTLNITDIATGWTEPIALLRKGSVEVLAALDRALGLVPSPILGLDCDNGTEFLNELLVQWCESHRVTFTRSREYKKNDQAWIEEKNGSVVRRHIGRERYEGREAWSKLTELYSVLRLYVNFYQPCQKLLFKHRNGARTYKKHDLAKTPYQRVLDSPYVCDTVKCKLRKQRASLDMFDLFNKIEQLQRELRAMAVDVPNPVLVAALAQRRAVHTFVSDVQGHQLIPTDRPGRKFVQALDALIATLQPGTLITAKQLLDLGNRRTIDGYLTRHARLGLLKRVSWGVYELTQQAIDLALSKQHQGQTGAKPQPAKPDKKPSIKARLRALIESSEPGTILTAKGLAYLGSINAINQYLHTHTKYGSIARVAKGVYATTTPTPIEVPHNLLTEVRN